jgi:hypothetical protein
MNKIDYYLSTIHRSQKIVMLPGEIGITARVDLQYRNRSAIYGCDYGNGWTRGDKKAGGLTLEYFFIFSYSS